MRLTVKTFLLTLPVIAVVLFSGGKLLVHSVEQAIERDVVEMLKHREMMVVHALQKDTRKALESESLTNSFSVTRIEKPFYARILSDTALFDEVDQRSRMYRQLTFGATINGENFRISVRRALVDHQIIETVTSTNMMIIFVLMGLSLVLSMQLISGFLWKPFYRTLDSLKDHDLNSGEPLKLEKTTTTEFQQLQNSVSSMSVAMREEFRQLKEFTENVSHEIRTPLAVIKARLEFLLQSEDISEDELRTIVSIQQAVDRLARMTEGLLLLVRIDRGAFDIKAVVDFRNLFQQKAAWFDDLIKIKKLELSVIDENNKPQKMNEALADTLVHNVLSNAVKYNAEGGRIVIHLNGRGFVIENSGPGKELSGTLSFKRYHTEDSSQGLGLGLSIVERICSYEKIEFRYEHSSPFHRFHFRFSPAAAAT